jgi:pimeloyl-ACP methyl ester carboxylesterase
VDRQIPRYTLDGVPDATVTMHPFSTEDGLGLELTRFHRADSDDVVLLLPGLPAGRDMFIMPEHRNLVSFLLDNGFTDVWVLDFRMSNRFPYDTETHRFTLDDIAHWDHPAALAELRRHIGDRRVHVVAQCLGSVSFSMALAAGTVDGIASMVSNSVSLVINLPGWSRVKLSVAPGIMEYLVGIPFFDPRHSQAPPFTRGWMLSKVVSLFHRECDVSACHMISFMWGSGRPGLWRHENLLPVTHHRVADLFGANGMHYYRHMYKMMRAGHAVRYDPKDSRHAGLPVDYLSKASDITTPVLFLTGDQNHVFADSNIVCHEVMSKAAPGLHELEILPGYGHVDPFIGKDAHVDVFPKIVDFLKRKAGG